MRLTWLGHASLRIESGAKIVFIDPYAGDESLYVPGDLILISQWHFDHCSVNMVKKSSNDLTVILGTPEVAAQIYPCGVLHVDEHRIFGDVEVIGMPAKNPHIDVIRHTDNVSKLGFLLNAEKKIIYFMSDSDFVPGTENLRPDVLLIPVGGTYTQGPREAAKTASLLNPKLAIPIHWGSVVGTRDDAEVFKELVDFPVKILNAGETIEL